MSIMSRKLGTDSVNVKAGLQFVVCFRDEQLALFALPTVFIITSRSLCGCVRRGLHARRVVVVLHHVSIAHQLFSRTAGSRASLLSNWGLSRPRRTRHRDYLFPWVSRTLFICAHIKILFRCSCVFFVLDKKKIFFLKEKVVQVRSNNHADASHASRYAHSRAHTVPCTTGVAVLLVTRRRP